MIDYITLSGGVHLHLAREVRSAGPTHRSMGFAVFTSEPSSEEITSALDRIWLKEGVRPKHGSIAVVERFHRTAKELLRLITIPEEQSLFEMEISAIIRWYNEHRPHETLGGKTPNEVYFSRPAANEQPRFEPRPRWPRGSPCAKPQVGIDGEPGDPIVLEIDCLDGRRHLPIIRARRAA